MKILYEPISLKNGMILVLGKVDGTSDFNFLSTKTQKKYLGEIKKNKNKHSVIVNSKENKEASVSILFYEKFDHELIVDSLRSLSEYFPDKTIYCDWKMGLDISDKEFGKILHDLNDYGNITFFNPDKDKTYSTYFTEEKGEH